MFLAATVMAMGGCEGEGWAPPSADELLRRAGVVRLEFDKRLRERLRIPGLTEVELCNSDPRIEFESAPCFQSRRIFPQGGADAPSEVAWGPKVAAPAFVETEPEMMLVADPLGRFARGVLTITPAPRSPLDTQAPRQILGVRTGCSMTTLTQFPIVLGEAPVTLNFEWDLHSSISLQGRRVLIENDFGDQPSFAIRCEDKDPLVHCVQRVLALPSDAPSELEFRARPGSNLSLAHLSHPPCIEVVDRQHDVQGVKLQFRETELARHFHYCSAVNARLKVDGDPAPFERAVRVSHARPMRDAEDHPILCAVLQPGENLELWTAEGVQRLAFTDRLSCGPALLAAQGLRRVAAAQVPASTGHVEFLIGEGAQAVRIQALVHDSVMRDFEAWSLGCGR